MRIGIVSARCRADSGALLATMPAGRGTLIERQIEGLINAQCRALICLADQCDPSLAELQRAVEERGLAFHIAENALGLVRHTRAADTVCVVGEGIVPRPQQWALVSDGGRSVHALSAPGDEAAGLERIDANRFWAGTMAVSGNTIEQLARLEPDVEPVSALLRIALQSGHPVKPLEPVQAPQLAMDQPGMMDLAAQERRDWLGQFGGLALFPHIAALAAPQIARRIPLFLLGKPVAVGLSAFGAAGAAGLASLGYPASGLMFLAICALIALILRHARAYLQPDAKDFADAESFLAELGLAAACFIAVLPSLAVPQLLAPLFSVLTIRLLALVDKAGLGALFADRILLLVGVGVALALGLATEAQLLFAIAGIGYAAWRLTQA